MPDGEKAHAKLCDEHQGAAEEYVVNRTTAYTVSQNLTEACEEARKALVESGALVMDQDGKIKAGWYKSDAGYENHRVGDTDNSGVTARGGAAAVAGAMGAPAAAWVAVGAFGTASTGAAIGGLSGAAATSATAAWFGGGAVAAGGLGIVAAPFVLSGVGIVVGASILGVAALVSRNRNNQNDKNMGDANKTMKEAMRRMEDNASKLKELEDCAKPISIKLIRATGVLLINKDQESANHVDQALTEADQLFPKLQEPLPYTRLYVGRPSPIESVTSIVADRNNISMRWKDPDDGNSEVAGYKIFYTTGFLGEEKSLMVTEKPEFTHTVLRSGTKYEYKIIPFNIMGEADVERTFEARTQSA